MKIKINIITYIALLLSFLSGYFDYTFVLIISIIIHELGHCIVGSLLKMKVKEIEIYLFGGITKLESSLNTKIYKEILMIISGPLVQILFILLMYKLNTLGIIRNITYEKIYMINILLLKFNLLPIIPLDGGRLLNNLLDYILPYKQSIKVTLLISLVLTPLIFFIIGKILAIYLFIFILINIYEEFKGIDSKLNKLLLERKLIDFNFRKTDYIDNINKVKRNHNYVIYKIQNA